MSTIQSKINFVEKKKTSARLQDIFKKEQELNCKSTRSDCKSVYSNEDVKHDSLATQSTNKLNPIVLLDRSLIKTYEGGSRHLQKTPPIEKYTSNNHTELNYTENIRTIEINNQISPTKLAKTVGLDKNDVIKQGLVEPKISPRKRSKVNVTQPNTVDRYLLRSSPTKREHIFANENIFNDEECSPPKRDCIIATPCQSIANLCLESPERQQISNTCKELFPRGKFDEACKALHSSAPTKLPGREDKLGYIKNYLLEHYKEEMSGTLYISGPPGTGKTACVNLAIEDHQIAKAYQTVFLNCTTMNSYGSIYSRIVKELKLKPLGNSEKACLTSIEKYLDSSKRKMILIILDELDQLCSKKQSVLYSIFEWPSRKNSRLVLLGIANALDLTDRVLPRLQARLALQPEVLHFSSYTRQQIIDIIADRLHQAGVEEVFSGATLQLLAGKVAAVNGDVRRALDIARRVVEVAESRSVLQPLPDNGATRQTVALQEVMTVVNDVYNTAQSLESSQSTSFPLQQKLLICSLLLIRQNLKAKDTSVGKLHEVYKKVCEKRNMTSLDMSEFLSLASLLEARGILRVTGKTHNRLSKVVLQWDENEVKSALQDKQLLAAVLMDKGVTV